MENLNNSENNSIKVTLVSGTIDNKTFFTEAVTLGAFKEQLHEMNISTEDMLFREGNTRLTLDVNNSILPRFNNLGEPIPELVIFMTKSGRKVKSGNTNEQNLLLNIALSVHKIVLQFEEIEENLKALSQSEFSFKEEGESTVSQVIPSMFSAADLESMKMIALEDEDEDDDEY